MKKFIAAVILLLILTTATVFAVTRFDAPYIGNGYKKTLHYRDCEAVWTMNPNNQVPFNTPEEAWAAGYHPCGNCRPDIPRY